MPSAVTFDGVALRADLSGDVVFGVFVVRALDIDVGPHGIEDRLGAGGMIDPDPVDVGERGQHLGPHILGKNRPSRSLVDVEVGGDRHHDDVALVARRLDVPDVAEMDEVEHAVAQRDRRAPCACADRAISPSSSIVLILSCASRSDGQSRVACRWSIHVKYPYNPSISAGTARDPCRLTSAMPTSNKPVQFAFLPRRTLRRAVVVTEIFEPVLGGTRDLVHRP